MDRFRHKTKKTTPLKYGDQSSHNTFISDPKTQKTGHKLAKELFDNVKSDSVKSKSMKTNEIMSNSSLKDIISVESNLSSEITQNNIEADKVSGNNLEVMVPTENEINQIQLDQDNHWDADLLTRFLSQLSTNTDSQEIRSNTNDVEKSGSNAIESNTEQTSPKQNDTLSRLPIINYGEKLQRTRKLSLDQTILLRRGSLSQSEVDLHAVGKSPLERKSSFFRKKLDSFLKNTTEIFKRQSLTKADSEGMKRKGSVSLQHLNERNGYPAKDVSPASSQDIRSSQNSIYSIYEASDHKMPEEKSIPDSNTGSMQYLNSNGYRDDIPENDPDLNDQYIYDQLVNFRAKSMSSGLDTVDEVVKKKTRSRANRVTWLASEGLTNYLRRAIQDEKSKETSNNDESLSTTSNSSKGESRSRKLSYHRAVSGEGSLRYDTTSRKRSSTIEQKQANYELLSILAEFSRVGVPPLQGYSLQTFNRDAFLYLLWADNKENLDKLIMQAKMGENETIRQTVIVEFIKTEVDYIRHLIAIVEIFIASAHALQDRGKLLYVDTERLFSNIPDILNANLTFWERAFYPMVQAAVKRHSIFNTALMINGFCKFKVHFKPYEQYINEQTRILDYLRGLSNNKEFMVYLNWCHAQKACHRLQLADIMVKPMQRLTKYGVILRRISGYTEIEPERSSLLAMEGFVRAFVLDVNRAIRQKEELLRIEFLVAVVDGYDHETKDEEMDRLFRVYSNVNLKAPMVGCLPNHSRSLIWEGPLRFRDSIKDMDVHVFLLTDMMLVCRKLSSKRTPHLFKMIRPKYMLDKMMHFKQWGKSKKNEFTITCVMLDDVGSSYTVFSLYDTTKEGQQNLKYWEVKIREAKLTYDLSKEYAKDPSRDVTIMETREERTKRTGVKPTKEDMTIEQEARERVATMVNRNMGASTEHDCSHTKDSLDGVKGEASTSGAPTPAPIPAPPASRQSMHRTSTGSSSWMSSYHYSTSATSHDEPQPCPNRSVCRLGNSVEHMLPPQFTHEEISTITVSVTAEQDPETIKPRQMVRTLVMPSTTVYVPRRVTLKVQPANGVMALVHSLPDLNIEPKPKTTQPPVAPPPPTASEKLYLTHYEHLNKLHLVAKRTTHYLTPDHRGISYPPPSPNRGSLQRSLAVSYSMNHPPLYKMGHVSSDSHLQIDVPSCSMQGQMQDEDEQGAINPIIVPSPATVKKAYKKDKKGGKKTKKSQEQGVEEQQPAGRGDDEAAI